VLPRKQKLKIANLSNQKWRYLLTFTALISLTQIAVFIVELVRGGIAPLSENVNIGPPTWLFVEMGAKDAYLMKYDHQVWRFIAPIFLHAGFLHIALNLIAQVQLGILAEREWGKAKFLITYFASGVGSFLMSCLVSPSTISVGASGAIYGLAGACMAHVILLWKLLEPKNKKWLVLQSAFILLAVGLLSLAPYIDWSAHVGGIAVGFLLGLTLLPDLTSPPFYRRVRFVFGLLVLAYFAIGFWYFFAVENPPFLEISGSE